MFCRGQFYSNIVFECLCQLKSLLSFRYFHEDATQEMLDEWRPWLCPFDMYVIGGLQCLDYFLPTSLPPELHHKGFKYVFSLNFFKYFKIILL